MHHRATDASSNACPDGRPRARHARALLALAALAVLLLVPASASLASGTGAPTDLKLPVVSGTARDTSYLKANQGTWEGAAPMTYAYTWRLCDAKGEECSTIAGASGHTYKLVHEDVGRRLRVIVTATNIDGSGKVESGPSALVAPLKPARGTQPIIAGVGQDGQVLSSSAGTWRGTPPFTYAYQWKACKQSGATLTCSPIAGATQATYRPETSQIGEKLEVAVTASNAAGVASVASKATKAIVAGPPVNTAAPEVSGTPIDGQTLGASTGSWAGTGPFTYTYQWRSCSLLTDECSNIAGATGATYTAAPLDVAHAIQVIVTATSAHGAASATSQQTSAVGALLPKNTELPNIVGQLLDGQLLKALTGAWEGTGPLSFSYQWQLCNSAGAECHDISEALAATLSLVSADIGETLRVAVTATNSAGSTTATSPATSIVAALLPQNLELPKITGALGQLVDGQLLSAVTGAWTGSGPLSYSYQWLLCNGGGTECHNISEALASTLTLVSADVGDTLRVAVTATNSGGSTTATSPATSIVGALLPSNLSLPSIAGSLIDGQLLSALTGSWKGTGPLEYAYQWQQCNGKGEECKNVSGAEATTFGLISSLVGDTMRVVVTATNAAGSTQATSPATTAIGALLPSNTGLPSVVGSLIDGETLSALTGSWKGTGPLSYAYQWQQCNGKGEECKDVTGAEATTFGIISSLVGDTMRVIVTATNAAGSSSATSPATSAIGALLPSNTGLPSVAGSLIDGETITALTGSWKGTGPLSYSYQWQQCNSLGGACEDVSKAQASTLGLISALVGDTLRVVVTATNSAGSTSATSPVSGLVGALIPSNTSQPSVVGSLIDDETLSALTGSWKGTGPLSYAYQWQQCNGKGEECKNVTGAEATTFGLISSLVGDTMRVTVTATNAAGTSSATSPATSAIGALLPSNTGLPSITGKLIDTETLSALTGSWKGTGPLSYSYRWQRCNSAGEACKEISGAEASTFGILSSLVGDTMRVVVTATNSAGSTSATSPATGLVGALLPSNTSLPSVAGKLIDTETLSALTGSWKGTGPLSYAYQWQQCNGKGEECKNVSGAEASTFGIISSLVGDTMRVIVTATNAAGSTSATSPATGLVGALLPSNTGVPSITGKLIDTETLSALTGSWKGTGPLSYSYKWQQCNTAGESCKEISGAEASTFGLISSLVGDTLRVVVTASNSAGSTSATSPATSIVGALLPSNTGLPSITGKLIDTETLSALTGSWKGTGPLNYAYQWQQCNGKGEECKNVSGAEATTFGLISSLVGDTMRVTVTATNSAGSTSATSPATSAIGALLPSNTGLPSITGKLIDTETLTALTGSWKGTAPLSYAYQWQQCKGEECKNVSGAEASTFGIVSSLVGDTMRVIVTATNAAGSTSATSPATGLIGALIPRLVSAPSITSSTKEPEQGSTLKPSSGSWEGTAPISYAYEWQQCNPKGEACKAISESKEPLAVAESLVKSTVRLAVTATNAGGSTKAVSAPTSPVLAALPVNVVAPVISGLLKIGEKLVAKHEEWKGTAPLEYKYQWQLCGVLGLVGECKNIAGATGENLLLELLDVGLTLRVGVTAHNERGSETVYSKVTGLVQGLGLSPTKGTAGTSVVIQAAGVSAAKTVNFGSTEVTPEVKSSNEIVAPAPEGTGTVPVTVSTEKGTTHEAPTDQFTYSG